MLDRDCVARRANDSTARESARTRADTERSDATADAPTIAGNRGAARGRARLDDTPDHAGELTTAPRRAPTPPSNHARARAHLPRERAHIRSRRCGRHRRRVRYSSFARDLSLRVPGGFPGHAAGLRDHRGLLGTAGRENSRRCSTLLRYRVRVLAAPARAASLLGTSPTVAQSPSGRHFRSRSCCLGRAAPMKSDER